MSKNVNGKGFTTFDDLWNDPEFVTENEKEQIDAQVALIGKTIEARDQKGLPPNKETQAAIEDVMHSRDVSRSFDRVDELMNDLDT